MYFFGGVLLRRSLPLVCLMGVGGDLEGDLLDQFLGMFILLLTGEVDEVPSTAEVE